MERYFIIGDAVHDAAEFTEDLIAEIRWTKREAGRKCRLRRVNWADVRRAICTFLAEEYGHDRIPAESYITVQKAIMPHLKAAGVI